MRVLLVEDDPALAESVERYLRQEGFAVDAVASAAAALRESRIFDYDVVVLDLNLPDADGLDVCRQLRERGGTARILMATARDAVAARVEGLDAGADDYLVKPYALAELVARVRALLRRPDELIPVTLRVGDLTLDTATRRARRGEREIELTAKEFAVLQFLMRNPGRVLTREQISERAWDANYDPLSNVIDVYIARLRRKLEAPGERPLLETIRGAGYRIAADLEPDR